MGMAFTLVINPGSSSKKFALYSDTVRLADAYIEQDPKGFLMCVTEAENKNCFTLPKENYQNCLKDFLETVYKGDLVHKDQKIKRVAIRIVAPGSYFQKHRRIDDEFKKKLTAAAVRAPLHIPHTIKEIAAAQQILPEAEIIGISDSAFHATMPSVSRSYSLPEAEMEELDIHRFGYHGISVSSVVRKMNAVFGYIPERVVLCHIGSGVSVTALKDGKSVDTSMGFAPGSGLVMSSRSGDVDAGALLAFMQLRNLKPKDVEVYLQSAGGLRAMAGESDLRLLLERKANGEAGATKALNAFFYHLQKTIGAYAAILGGVDAIVLTATASERSPALRDLLLKPLQFLGFGLDTYLNSAHVNCDGIISSKESKVKVAVIKTNEADEMVRLCLSV